jgi:hypothetical protein
MPRYLPSQREIRSRYGLFLNMTAIVLSTYSICQGHGMTILSTADITESEVEDDPYHKSKLIQEGPINHKSIFKLSVVEVIANFTVSVGFYLVGSGVGFIVVAAIISRHSQHLILPNSSQDVSSYL